jgi:hypothetical protein
MSRALRSACLFAFVSAVVVLSMPGCSQQGQGERCDSAKTGNADCNDGLTCVPAHQLADGTTDRCCPAENTESDSRCLRGGSVGSSGGSSTGGSSSGGSTSSGGSSAAGEASGGMSTLPETGGVAGTPGSTPGGTSNASAGMPATTGGAAGAASASGGAGGAP